MRAPCAATSVLASIVWLICVHAAWLWPSVASVVIVKARGGSTASLEAYSVVVDAGSTGSRVHVFRLDRASGHLLDEAEVEHTTTPGISACAANRSLLPTLLGPLLSAAEDAVPKGMQPATLVTVQATAGLRLLPGQQAESILQDVRGLLARHRFRIGDVRVMSGAEEGTFQWLAVNTLLSSGSENVCGGGSAVVLDLGGASLQVAYSIRRERLENTGGREGYVREVDVPGGCKVPLYQHSYLGYGILAARAKMFEEAQKSGLASSNPCLLAGWEGQWTDTNSTFHGVGAPNAAECKRLVAKTLRPWEPCGQATSRCSFAGVWAGPGWEQQGHQRPKIVGCGALFVALKGVGVVPDGHRSVAATPRMYRDLATAACAVPWAEVAAKYPARAKELAPWICFDLTYFSAVLELGLGLSPHRELLVAEGLEHVDSLGRRRGFSATWPLGVALAAAAEGESAAAAGA